MFRQRAPALGFACAVAAIAACGSGDGGAPDAACDAADDADVFDPASFRGPFLLSETGLYADVAARSVSDDVVEYDVAFPLWSDGSGKRRWLRLPAGTRIDMADPDGWVFPVGTSAWKEFRVDGRPIETRYLHKNADGSWLRVSYLWREDGSDADARPEGVVNAIGTTHDVPDVPACIDCHRGARDELIGLSSLQLGSPEADASRARLVAAGWIDDLPTPPLEASPEERAALGVLHGNCAHCHGPHHPLARLRTMRLHWPYSLTDAREAPARTTTMGAPAVHRYEGLSQLVAPGDPARSQLLDRMDRRDLYRMPSRGTEVVDERGVEVVREWIASMAP